MFSIHLMRSDVAIERFVKAMPVDLHFVVLKPEYVCVPRFVQYAFVHAFKTFESRGTAKTLSLEWLCRLALTQNVSKALVFTRPESGLWCIAAVNVEKSELAKFGEFQKPGREFCEKARGKIIEVYGVPKKALEVYNLEDLLIEKAVVENV